jgi:ATP-binding cassette, subfamily B, bacterial MsbA
MFEGVSAGLLIPTLEGALRRDFEFLRDIKQVRWGLDVLPASWSQGDAELFGLLVGVIFAAVFFKLAFHLAANLLFDKAVFDLTRRLKMRCMERYMRFGKRFFDIHNAGQLESLVLHRPLALSGGMRGARMGIYWFCSLVAYVGLMLVISWKLSLIVAVLFPILYWGLSGLIRRIQESSKDHAAAIRRQHEHAFNVLSCMPLVKAMNMEQRELGCFDDVTQDVADIETSQASRNAFVYPVQELILITAVLLLVVVVGMLVGGEGAALSGFLVFFYLLRRSSTNFNDLNRLRGSFAGLSGLLDESLELLDDAGKPFLNDGEKSFSGLKREIRFHDLTFGYEAEPVLHEINCALLKGQTTAIVGRTGSGKSTLVSLLMRFYEVPKGSITIDGVDIRDLSIASLRDRMAYVNQDCYLLNDTIRANITYGLQRTVSAEELQEVLGKARLDELVSRQAEGLEARVGDRGIMVSGGEKQRIALARALLREPEIMILDEATSSLDSRTEQWVQEAIDACLVGRTAVVIAHRLSTIKNADRILLLEDGRLVEEGTLDELLALGGRFLSFWEAQSFEVPSSAATGNSGARKGTPLSS